MRSGLGQRRTLSRRDAELGPPPAGGRPRVASIGKLHFRSHRRRQWLRRRDPADARARRHRRPARRACASRRPRAAACRRFARRGAGRVDLQPLRSPSDRAACAGCRASRARREKPWALFVSFVRPHFPLIAPPEFFALYDPEKCPAAPVRRARAPDPPGDPGAAGGDELRRLLRYHDAVRLAIAAYYALVSFLDHNIGRFSLLWSAGLAGSRA